MLISKVTRFRGFRLHFTDSDAMESMCREAEHFQAFFTPRSDDALFIDAGANIGVMMLECKSRWPQAKILCFEPDPFAFAILQRNVDDNDLPGVRCIQAALSDHDGTAVFYGDIAPTADARGNSLLAHWAQRPGTSSCEVSCKRLSPFLANQRIDFLKLDIEGSEWAVLQEIAPHLHQIDAIYVEVHQTRDSLPDDSVKTIKDLLNDAGFQVEVQPRYQQFALPDRFQHWQQQAQPQQTQLLCWR